jgi:hypothetical protein
MTTRRAYIKHILWIPGQQSIHASFNLGTEYSVWEKSPTYHASVEADYLPEQIEILESRGLNYPIGMVKRAFRNSGCFNAYASNEIVAHELLGRITEVKGRNIEYATADPLCEIIETVLYESGYVSGNELKRCGITVTKHLTQEEAAEIARREKRRAEIVDLYENAVKTYAQTVGELPTMYDCYAWFEDSRVVIGCRPHGFTTGREYTVVPRSTKEIISHPADFEAIMNGTYRIID